MGRCQSAPSYWSCLKSSVKANLRAGWMTLILLKKMKIKKKRICSCVCVQVRARKCVWWWVLYPTETRLGFALSVHMQGCVCPVEGIAFEQIAFCQHIATASLYSPGREGMSQTITAQTQARAAGLPRSAHSPSLQYSPLYHAIPSMNADIEYLTDTPSETQ